MGRRIAINNNYDDKKYRGFNGAQEDYRKIAESASASDSHKKCERSFSASESHKKSERSYSAPESSRSREKGYADLKPKDICKKLEAKVFNQSEACQLLSAMIYRHFQGSRFVWMLAGPTGSGKSFIVETLKEMFPDVVYVRDVSNVTNDGWKGSKKVSSLFNGVTDTCSAGKIIHPVIFLDECDKMMAPRTASGGENTSESIQGEFLSAIQGTEMETGTGPNGKRMIDTGTCSFIFAGAFAKRADAVAEKERGASIGFDASRKEVLAYTKEITMEDVRAAGCISELCGRIQGVTSLNRFDESAFRKMLDLKGSGPIYELEKQFKTKIHISDAKKDELAHYASESGLGVRGMKNLISQSIYVLTWQDCDADEYEIA